MVKLKASTVVNNSRNLQPVQGKVANRVPYRDDERFWHVHDGRRVLTGPIGEAALWEFEDLGGSFRWSPEVGFDSEAEKRKVGLTGSH